MSWRENTSVNVPFPCRAESPLRSRYMLLGPVETGDSYQKKPPTRTLRYETTLTDGVASTSNRSATLPAFPLVGLGLMNVCERVASSLNAVELNRTRSSRYTVEVPAGPKNRTSTRLIISLPPEYGDRSNRYRFHPGERLCGTKLAKFVPPRLSRKTYTPTPAAPVPSIQIARRLYALQFHVPGSSR